MFWTEKNKKYKSCLRVTGISLKSSAMCRHISDLDGSGSTHSGNNGAHTSEPGILGRPLVIELVWLVGLLVCCCTPLLSPPLSSLPFPSPFSFLFPFPFPFPFLPFSFPFHKSTFYSDQDTTVMPRFIPASVRILRRCSASGRNQEVCSSITVTESLQV